MTDLRTAAQQALKILELEGWGYPSPKTAEAITALKAALVEPENWELRRLREELERCKQVCAATAEAWREEAALGCDHCKHPLYAAIKCRVCGRVTKPAPPQRKPLAEWQINDLMADIDPEDRDSWSFRQGVYAAEKHHGVRP